MTRVFLDANIFVAAAASAEGGSALLLEAGRKNLLEVVSSHLALLEAERNIRKKLPLHALNRFHRLLQQMPLLIVPSPSLEEVRRCETLINAKDAPILAAALSSRAEFLITLDQRHFLSGKLRNAHLPFKIVTPRDFFRAAAL